MFFHYSTNIFLFIILAFVAAGLEASNKTVQSQPKYKEQIKQLSNKTTIKAALKYITTLEKISEKNLIELTQIPAPPFGEEKRAKRFAQMLREAGLKDVVIDEVGNVIGRRPGNSSARVIAYSAHLDTVFPAETNVTVKKQGDKYYAPGIGDNTRGLITVLGVLRALQYAKITTSADILFVGNVGEEGLGDLRGVKHLFRKGAEKIDALIAIDGGSSERIVYSGIGSHRYRVIFSGPGGHSWGAFGLANPHHALGRTIAHFVATAPTVSSVGEKTTYNIGRMGGGTSVNSIPFESWMEVDMRSSNQRKIDKMDALLQAAVQKALKEENKTRLSGPELTVKVKSIGKRPAAKGNMDTPLVQQAIAATEFFGVTPNLKASSTDANIPISMGIPAVTMSRGGIGGRAHSLDEWWQNKDGHIAIQIALLTLLAQAGFVQ